MVSRLKNRIRNFGPLNDFFVPRIFPSMQGNVVTHSQYGQDIVLRSILKLLPVKEKYIFVDIGAHDGVTFSNSYFLENSFDWSGFCIEANPTLISKLKSNRPNASIFNIAISSRDSVEKFIVNQGHTEMLSGLELNYKRKHEKRVKKERRRYKDTYRTVQIHVASLNNFASSNNIPEIDLLLIDVEGSEYEIVRNLDFNKLPVSIIVIERNFSSKGIYSHLLKAGFIRVISVGSDDLYLNQSLLCLG